MKCQKGDLAFITHSRDDMNNGAMVKCEFIDTTDPVIGVTWGVTTMTSIYDYNLCKVVPAGQKGICIDRFLNPLPGLTEDDDQEISAPISVADLEVCE